MSDTVIRPEPITGEEFAPYGDLIHAAPATRAVMNDGRFESFNNLASIDVTSGGGRVAISIARCRHPTALPYVIDMVERHPHGSQAFIPLTPFSFVVVVAPASDKVDAAELRAFITDGTQGINYHKGVWHMPMIAFEAGQEFLVVDRAPATDNCDEFIMDPPLTLEGPRGDG